MADYFVAAGGSDATGDGSATNPWATVNKAIGSGGGASAAEPNRVILRGGDLFREAISTAVSPSESAPLTILGDDDGSLFAAAGGVGGIGLPEIRAWSADNTPIAASAIAMNTKSDITIQKLSLVGGSSGAGSAVYIGDSTRINIRDCVLNSYPVKYGVTLAGNTTDVTIERCIIDASSGDGVRVLRSNAPTDYAINVTIRSCLFLGGAASSAFGAVIVERIGSSDAGGPTGVEVTCCTFSGARGSAVRAYNWTSSPKIITVRMCLFVACQTGVSASANGSVDEDYNIFYDGTPRSNVDAGVNSRTDLYPALTRGAAGFADLPLRPMYEPQENSPVLAFGPRPDGLTVDMLGRERPDPCAAGCLERADPPGGGGEPAPVVNYIFQVEG